MHTKAKITHIGRCEFELTDALLVTVLYDAKYDNEPYAGRVRTLSFDGATEADYTVGQVLNLLRS